MTVTSDAPDPYTQAHVPAVEPRPESCFVWHPTAAAICTLTYGHPATDHLSAFGHVWPRRDKERRLTPVVADAEQNHLVDEVQHPDIEAAYQEIARCYTCGQALPEVTG